MRGNFSPSSSGGRLIISSVRELSPKYVLCYGSAILDLGHIIRLANGEREFKSRHLSLSLSRAVESLAILAPAQGQGPPSYP